MAKLAIPLVLLGLAALLVAGFLAGRSEQDKEREKEEPIKVEANVSKTAAGQPVVSLDQEAIAVAGVSSSPLEAPVASSADILLPRPAIVRSEGKAWVYLDQGQGHYLRQEAPLDRPVPDGWLAGAPFRAGDRIVTRGAQVLFSEESKSQIRVGS